MDLRRARATAAVMKANTFASYWAVIFTSPGERVNRPTFGSGILQLIFAPNSPEVAATLQSHDAAAIQQWLGDIIELRNLK